MESRGPDSAGFAIYKNEKNKDYKYSLCISDINFETFKKQISKEIKVTSLVKNSDHVILKTKEKPSKINEVLSIKFKNVSLVGYGNQLKYLNKLEIRQML